MDTELDEWTDGRKTDALTPSFTDARTDGRTDAQRDGQLVGRRDGRVRGCTRAITEIAKLDLNQYADTPSSRVRSE